MTPPRETVGPYSLERIPEILHEHRVRAVFLVTGKTAFEVSGAKAALEPYLRRTSVHRFSGFQTNPRVEDVRRGVDALRKAAADVVIAVGGGSAMDVAKLVNVTAANPSDPLRIIRGDEMIQRPGVPLVAVPTTAGTGSEVTHFAVAYVGHTKYSVAHEFVRPTYALVEPALSHSMSPRLTAISGFDALSQAIESYWSVGATESSQGDAAKAIRLVLESLQRAVRQPDDEVRRRMAEGAYWSGKAIDVSRTTGPHALSYSLTAHFDVPHGHAVALTLGRFFIINSNLDGAELNDSRGKQYLRRTLDSLYSLLGCSSSIECCEMLYDLMDDVGLETELDRLGVGPPGERESLVAEVNEERLGNNPVKLREHDLRTLVDSL